jgi:integrase
MANLRNRSARRSIANSTDKEQKKLHVVKLSTGLALGYRKGVRGGSWIARKHESGTRYTFQPLGIADDAMDADGIRVLTFDQAQEAARSWIKRKVAEDAGEVVGGSYSVAQALFDYIEDRQREKRKDMKRTRSVVNLHILPTLGSIEVGRLTHSKVKHWRDSLAEVPPRVRAKKGDESGSRTIDSDNAQAIRKRHATANRIYTVLRAALNFAYRRNRIATKSAWERITPFRQVDAPKIRYITVGECKRLIEVCPADFRRLVRAALYTGARYSELTSLRVNAFNADSQTIHIAESKSGKSRFIALTDEAIAFFQSVAYGKDANEFLFTHDEGRHSGKPWQLTQQTYWMKFACAEAKIEPAVSFHILRHTFASQLAMNNTPMPVIAASLGHADTRMTERHYAHLGQSYIADVVRANLPSFGFESGPTLIAKAS